MAHVVVYEPGRVPVSVPLDAGLRLGRGPENDLVLADTKVSRQHARIEAGDGGWVIVDLGSTHGLLVNSARVERRLLEDGDRIQLGSVLLEYAARTWADEIVHEQATAQGPPVRSDDGARRLRLLYDLAGVVGRTTDPDELLGRMLDSMLDTLNGERAVAGVLDPTGGLRRVARARRPGEVIVSRALLDAVLARRESVLVRTDGGDAAASLVRQRVVTALGAPLLAGARLLGFVYVDDSRRAFGPEDLDFLVALAHLTAAALDEAERRQRAAASVEALRELARPPQLLGESEPILRLLAQLPRVAQADVNVLVRGESGTGKELVARTLHSSSARAGEAFVALNCAALPDTMVESELFGYERGAFTGAVKAKRGRFALADHGTLFLDEIGDLSLAAQAKLLRAIEEGEVQPLGAERPLHVDCRIVAASHRDLRAEVAAGRFREDLFYRLAVMEVVVPPLRERGDDVVGLALAFLGQVAPRAGRRVLGFTAAALDALRRHPWPGNVRELRNEVERAVIVAEGELIEPGDLSPRVAAPPGPPSAGRSLTLAERFAELEPTEERLVSEAMTAAQGNVSEAARLLGISRIMLRRRLERRGGKV